MIVTLSGPAGSAVARGDRDALFPVYSLTKTVIGATFTHLAAEGRLRLDDSLRDWVADNGLPDVTLRQLLNHTSGIPDYARLPKYHAAVRTSPSTAWSDEELVERALALGMDFAPGEGWAYSNTGYLLLRVVMDRFGGLEPTLQRLGLDSTFVATDRDDLYAAVQGESEMLGGDVRGVYDPLWVGHRTLISNCADLHQFLTGLLVTQQADPDTFVDIGQPAPGFARAAYGLGVMADVDSPLGVVVGHGGHGPGYAAAGFATLGTDGNSVAAVALSNQEQPSGTFEQIALDLLLESY
jgi:D-alanyl-D-alanine carboxypeptidase